MTKKILIVIASIGGGGAERVAVQLANYFAENNLVVQVCYWNVNANEYAIVDSVIINYVSSRFRAFAVAKTIREFKPNVLLSFTDVSNVVSYFAKLIARSNVAHLPTIHSDLQVRDSHLQSNIKNKLLRVLHQHACNKSKKIVVVSEGARKSLVEYYNIADDKCVCIYNPVLNDVKFKGSKVRIQNTTLKIVAAGRLTQAKNYPLLIQVAELLKNKQINFTVDIFGEGELKNELRQMIDHKRLSKYVQLRGFAPNLSQNIENYDLFLMTSSWEGFGNVLVEALENGLKVISTDCPSGPREVLDNGVFGTLVPVNDADAIVDVILNRSFDINQDLEVLIEHLNKFTLNSVGEKYLKLFAELK
jgi:glycosyltransferase involved in cell wall biosynthesis